MHDASDMELLRDYDRQGSEAAFAVLVQRHINLVYSVALRHVGIAAHAEEITQAVFIILARKSAGLRADTILEGWLHETTRLTALSFLRGERRRQFREQEAYMQSTLQENHDAVTWNQLAPLLDEAVARLGKKDRDAVMLRFFKDKNLREVAAALNVNETAAQRRVHRAVEKLRGFFTKHGIVLPAAILTATISANYVQAAPVALAKSVTAMAIAKGAAASSSTLVLVKGTMKIMTWVKLKFAVGIGAAALLAGSVVTVAVTNATGNGERYQIDGNLVYQTSVTRNFTLTVNDCNWTIRMTGQEPQPGIKYEEVTHLNGSVYRYTFLGKPEPGGVVNSADAVIEFGDSAIEDGSFANFVWVGLASGCYRSEE